MSVYYINADDYGNYSNCGFALLSRKSKASLEEEVVAAVGLLGVKTGIFSPRCKDDDVV